MGVNLKAARTIEDEATILLDRFYPKAHIGKGFIPIMECHVPSAFVRLDRSRTIQILNASISRLHGFLDTHPDILPDDRHGMEQFSGKLETLRQISNGQQIMPFLERVERNSALVPKPSDVADMKRTILV